VLTAALFFAGPGATLSHATADWWWGLIDDRPKVILVARAPPARAGAHARGRLLIDRRRGRYQR
jgi:hypothetical protein